VSACDAENTLEVPKNLGLQVANTWTELTARDTYAMVRNGKGPENLNFSLVAATLEKVIT
jgi:hypothetical protein